LFVCITKPVMELVLTKNEHIEQTLRKERPRLLNFIRKRVPDREEAEDILQDVFTQLVFSFESIQSIERVGSWLYTTARNRITDYFRKKRPDRFSDHNAVANDGEEILGLEDIIQGDTIDPDDELMNSLVLAEIEDAIADLPEDQREVFLMHEFEGHSFKELEAITGVPLNTLLSRKRYAVIYLRSRLENLYEQINTW
jgi:RNA polymerase sigma factor (sigma-70 family)